MTFGLLGFTGLGYLWVNAPEITTALWVYYLGYGATGFPNIAFGVGVRSTSQRVCPPDVLGRVGGLQGAVGGAAGDLVADLCDGAGADPGVRAVAGVAAGVGFESFAGRVDGSVEGHPAFEIHGGGLQGGLTPRRAGVGGEG